MTSKEVVVYEPPEPPIQPIVIDFRNVNFEDVKGVCRDPKEENPFGICTYIRDSNGNIYNIHFTRAQAMDMRDSLSLTIMADTEMSKHPNVIVCDFKNKIYTVEEPDNDDAA